MIQSGFSAVVCAKAEGFFEGQLCLDVETLYDSAGELTFCAEPVEQERAVSTQHPPLVTPLCGVTHPQALCAGRGWRSPHPGKEPLPLYRYNRPHFLPDTHAIASTRTPHAEQATLRRAYIRNTGMLPWNHFVELPVPPLLDQNHGTSTHRFC